jgi:hypothetical protein
MTIFIRGHVKVLYIHVPKTGGGTIMDFFKSNGFDVAFCDTSSIISGFNALRTCSPQHYHRDLLKQTLRLESFTYVFMTVRHPIDRLKSEFLWRVRDKSADPNSWAYGTLANYEKDEFLLDNHIRPQHEFLLPGADIFRLEDGYEDAWINRISESLGVEMAHRNVDHKNVAMEFSGRSVEDVHFNEAASSAIAHFYRNDFGRFGYTDRSTSSSGSINVSDSL